MAGGVKKCAQLDQLLFFNAHGRERDGERIRFFLGASRSGYKESNNTGPWEYVIGKARFYVLDAAELLNLAGWSLARAPRIIITSGPSASRFGACGETYPFRILLKFVFHSLFSHLKNANVAQRA